MGELAEDIDGLPNICGSEQRIEEAIRAGGTSTTGRSIPTRQWLVGVKSGYWLNCLNMTPVCQIRFLRQPRNRQRTTESAGNAIQ